MSGNTIVIKPKHELTVGEQKILLEKISKNPDGITIKHADELPTQAVYTQTQDGDIERDKKGEFELIKSRFKFWDSFKMGLSGLKVKKVRLAFTILLTALALTFFGVADTAASFDAVRAMHESINANGDNMIGVSKRIPSDWGREYVNLDSEDLGFLQSRFPQHNFVGVHAIDQITFTYDAPQHFGYYHPVTSAATLTQQQFNAFGLSFIGGLGSLPAAVNQIAITDYQFEALRELGLRDGNSRVEITNIGNVLNTTFNAGAQSIEIVGVINTGFDFERYRSLREHGMGHTLEDWMLANELQHVLGSTFSNTLFIYADGNPLLDRYVLLRNFGTYWFDFPALSGWSDMWDFTSALIEQRDIMDNVVFFDGTRTEAGINEVVVSHNALRFMPGNDIEVQLVSPFQVRITSTRSNIITIQYFLVTQLENELITLIRDFYSENRIATDLRASGWASGTVDPLLREFDIVGVYISIFSDSQVIYFNEETVRDWGFMYLFAPYSMILATLRGNMSDRGLIRILMEYDNSGPYLVLRNQFSSFFDNFTQMVEVFASVFLWIGLVFALFSALLIMSYITMTISHKKHDIGILRAMGARRIDIFKIFMNQSLVITAIQWMLSIILTLVVVIILNSIVGSELGMPVVLLSFGIRQIALLLAVALSIAVIASFLPTRKISKMKPIDAIQNRK
ncbi:MAG: FtsX-like permease family protein [Firmicutes bacterium]|nr:FtsX-like permease family protein [Bacillota bacterium]